MQDRCYPKTNEMLHITHLDVVGELRFAEAEAEEWFIIKSDYFSIMYWPKKKKSRRPGVSMSLRGSSVKSTRKFQNKSQFETYCFPHTPTKKKSYKEKISLRGSGTYESNRV